MKKTAAFFAIAGILALFASCSSTPDGELLEEETYEEADTTPIAVKEPKKKEKKTYSDPYDVKGLRAVGGSLTELFTTKKYYNRYEESGLYLSKTKKRKCTFVHRPDTELAGFVVRYDSAQYASFFASEDRKAIINAIKNYTEDFEAKKLDRKLSKSERAYGEIKSYQEFGIADSLMKNYVKPKTYLGYKFFGKSAFFCIFFKATENLAEKMSDLPESSINQKYYFTRAQAQRLAEFLSDENVASLMNVTPQEEELSEPEVEEEKSWDDGAVEDESLRKKASPEENEAQEPFENEEKASEVQAE